MAGQTRQPRALNYLQEMGRTRRALGARPRGARQPSSPTQESAAGRSSSAFRQRGQPSSASRPAAVIEMRTTSTVLSPAFTGSPIIAMASPSWSRPASILVSNPWAITSRSPVAPCGSPASSSSDRRCSRVRRGFGVTRFPSPSEPIEGNIARRWTADYRTLEGVYLLQLTAASKIICGNNNSWRRASLKQLRATEASPVDNQGSSS